MSKEMKVFIKEPGKAPEYRTVPNTLEALQEIVGGYIETVTVEKDLVIICSGEAWPLDLPYNCAVCGEDFYGTVIFAGVDGDEFADCPWPEDSFEKMVLAKRRDVACGRQAAQSAEGKDHTPDGGKAGRTATVTWYRPEEKLPQTDVMLLVVHGKDYMDLAHMDGDGAWVLDGWPEIRGMQVHWWCELPNVPDAEEYDDE